MLRLRELLISYIANLFFSFGFQWPTEHLIIIMVLCHTEKEVDITTSDQQSPTKGDKIYDIGRRDHSHIVQLSSQKDDLTIKVKS